MLSGLNGTNMMTPTSSPRQINRRSHRSHMKNTGQVRQGLAALSDVSLSFPWSSMSGHAWWGGGGGGGEGEGEVRWKVIYHNFIFIFKKNRTLRPVESELP
jgi:hypothetical protein